MIYCISPTVLYPREGRRRSTVEVDHGQRGDRSRISSTFVKLLFLLLHFVKILNRFYETCNLAQNYYVPEVLNVHMNEIYKKLTTINNINENLKKYLKKWHFLSQKLIINCLKKNPSRKSRFFYYFRSHEHSELPTRKITEVNVCDPVSGCGHFFIFSYIDEANDKKPYDNHYKHYPEWIRIRIDMNRWYGFWIFFNWTIVFDVLLSEQWYSWNRLHLTRDFWQLHYISPWQKRKN